ncbi:MAG: MotA/TolQ/ExbB proton channel family protein, partial [Muribaculaceae bacterium]|nr:MotA/TolQ/ExbB proton channel family protein [Muribaculaceae bacterium]
MIQDDFTVVHDTLEALVDEGGHTVSELSLWDLCMSGGWIMLPLAALAIMSVYIFVERAMVLHRACKEDATFMRRIKDYIHDGEIESACNLCRNNGSPYARLIHKGISRIGRPMNDVLVAIENMGNIEIAKLSRGLPWLATTASGAPMIGFLGTVIGMVQAFY